MGEVRITDEMVEAGAKAHYDLQVLVGVVDGYFATIPWDNLDLTYKDSYRKAVKAVLTAALSGMAEPVAWQPIATAPKDGTADEDGTWFIAYQDGEIYACVWHVEEPEEGPGYEGWYDLFNRSFEEPTHWMPLPAPPLQTEGK